VRPLIEGWTSDREAAELGRLAAGRVVLEVGTYRGFGAVLMARAGAVRVWAVDWHRGDPDLGERDTLCGWWGNVRRHGVADQVVGLVGRSEVVLPLLRPQSFELAFIDAYHAEEAVRRDIELVLPLMRPAGVLAFHDYSTTWPGVIRAVDALRERQGRGWPMRVIDSLAVLELKETSRASPRPD
jgi:predicted O-methyltransferase YrrM